MTLALKHKKTSTLPDGPDSDLVRPSDWNDGHELTMATGKLVGRSTAGDGAAEEIALGSTLSMSGGKINTSGQIGSSTTPANNFTLDASADNGTMKLARGNAGATTQDLITVSASNVITGGSGTVLVGNVPAFSAYQSVSQTLASGTTTKLNLQSEVFDTNGYFDTSTSRFQPLVAGYYHLSGVFTAASSYTGGWAYIFKNGTTYTQGAGGNANLNCFVVSAIVYLNGTTDYVELHGHLGTGQQLTATQVNTRFEGFLVRAA